MENASKALIIAGAILLSILIIGLGMFIFNQAKNATSNIGLDTQKANAYNQEFEQYFGDKQSGSNVKALVDAVRSHNVASDDDSQIKINDKNTASDLNTYKATITAGGTYKVQASENGYADKTGYLTEITITKNN